MKLPKAKKLPSGNWFIRLRLGGESIPITEATEAECKNTARLIKAEYLAGKQLKSRSDLTLSEMVDSYIKSRKAVLSPATIAGYETIKDNRFKDYMDKKPSAIKSWQQVINDEVKTGISGKTLKNSWSLIIAALKDNGESIPAVKLPQIVQAERPWLDAEQIKTFVKAVHGKDCEIPALLALHSLRRSEILGLTWDKIDLKNNIIRIEGSAVPGEKNRLVYKETNKTKNSRRNVPIMIPALKTAILAIPKEQRTGKIYTRYQNILWRDINRICKENGLPEVGVHGLRHSFVSLARHVGLDERDTMLIGGWEDAKTMHKIYEHISDADRIKAENKITAFFQNVNENVNKNQKSP